MNTEKLVKAAGVLSLAFCLGVGITGCGQSDGQETTAIESEHTKQGIDVSVERLGDGPIIYPGLDETLEENIQGPTVIKVPEWIENPLGEYYLYFADHKGSQIKLAYADKIEGPWKIYQEGAINLEDTTFLQEPPALTPEMEAELPKMAEKLGLDPDSKFAHDLAEESTTPHIASPEVIVDDTNKQIIMYLHGLSGVAVQTTRIAFSSDGIHFTQTSNEDLGTSYLRVFSYGDYTYGISMPGQLYRSQNGLTGFEKGNVIFDKNTRHHDIYLDGDTLYVFYTMVGDAPEKIYVATIDVSKPWDQWELSEPSFVMQPEYDWEGADAPVEPSIRSTAYGHVNQLRDPHIFEENGQLYLFYAVAGESGIAVAKIDINK